jgi:glycosyltransferase involved in cell wall biosynthesis
MRSIWGRSNLRYLIPFLQLLEKFTVSSASRVNLVSRGFKAYFERKYKQTQYSFFPNGVDDEFLKFEPTGSNQISHDKRLIFTYTGNIGEGQGLENIVPQIAERYRNIQFRIIGDGGRKEILRRQVSDLGNVFLLDPVERKELINYYDESDVLFLHLNNYDAFRKVLPSKIFEYAATYKPIIAGVDGYAKEFLETYLPESLIFKPSDFDDFCNKFIHFRGEVDPEKRKDFIAKFSRHSIMSEMVKDFLSISY